jgi:hypothetical protein
LGKYCAMSIALRKYIEDSHKLKTVLIQAKIDEDLAYDFRSVCEKNGWKQTEAVRAGIRKLVDDELDRSKQRSA